MNLEDTEHQKTEVTCINVAEVCHISDNYSIIDEAALHCRAIILVSAN